MIFFAKLMKENFVAGIEDYCNAFIIYFLSLLFELRRFV